MSLDRTAEMGAKQKRRAEKGPVRHRRRTIGRRAILFDRPLAGRDATVARITIFLCQMAVSGVRFFHLKVRTPPFGDLD